MKHRYGGIVGSIVTPTQSNASGIWSQEDYIDALTNNSWPVPPNIVKRSIRLGGTSYFTRTPATAGNRKTWTYSSWMKRTKFGSTVYNFLSTLYTSTNGHESRFDDNNPESLKLVDITSTSAVWILQTNAVFKDPNAWYHVVIAFDTTQSTASDRVKLYVNGSLITSFLTATYPSLNFDSYINSTVEHYIGAWNISGGSVARQFNGYFADTYFIDGQALPASLFGEYNIQTGIWVPKPYYGTYGTNGYRLNFSDNSSTAALGLDSSGNGNNWTPNNFSVTPGVDNDSLLDSPSIYNYDFGNGGEVIGNYATLNPIESTMTGVTLSKGNLRFTQTSAYSAVRSTIPFEDGKWYFEVTLNTSSTAGGFTYWCWGGIAPQNSTGLSAPAPSIQVYATTNTGPGIYKDGSLVHSVTGWASGQILSWAFDATNLTLDIYRNGVQIGSRINVTAPPTGKKYVTWFDTYFNGMVLDFNYGQRPWAYPPPSGYKALTSTNISAPPIGLAAGNRASNYFDTLLYTGNGSSNTIVGASFTPDLVWIKSRSAATSHSIYDSVRGVQKELISDGTSLGQSAETTQSNGLTAFVHGGFSVGSFSNVNTTSATYTAWMWNAGGVSVTDNSGTISSTVRANRQAGFSIVSYTGNGSGTASFGHGLGATPAFIIAKVRSTTESWPVYHQDLSSGYFLELNTNAAQSNTNTRFPTAPTSSVVNISATGNGNAINLNGATYIAYCWAPITGFSAFGTYTGNGSADGPFVYTGFRPRFYFVKRRDSATDWDIRDTARDTYNPANFRLYPNRNLAQESVNGTIDILSNGFKIRTSDSHHNASSAIYIYIAFAESPFRQSIAR